MMNTSINAWQYKGLYVIDPNGMYKKPLKYVKQGSKTPVLNNAINHGILTFKCLVTTKVFGAV